MYENVLNPTAKLLCFLAGEDTIHKVITHVLLTNLLDDEAVLEKQNF